MVVAGCWVSWATAVGGGGDGAGSPTTGAMVTDMAVVDVGARVVVVVDDGCVGATVAEGTVVAVVGTVGRSVVVGSTNANVDDVVVVGVARPAPTVDPNAIAVNATTAAAMAHVGGNGNV